jgi:phosphatidylglycerophosphatase A
MNLARLIASGLGTGFAPRAPGTVGSLAALIAGAFLLLLPVWVLPVCIVVVTLAGIWATARAGGADDPGWVVIDEVAGQWIALLPLARPTPLGLLAAFVLFRLLDITKPGPIGWADRQHGAIGVMADDVIAGAIAALVLWAAQRIWPGLWT